MTLTPAKIYIALVRRLHFLVLLALMVPCYCLIVIYGLPAGRRRLRVRTCFRSTRSR